MTTTLGTVWVAPGEGSTIAEIAKAIPLLGTAESATALQHMSEKVNNGESCNHKTNLQLTGAEISVYDLRRIAVCE